MATIDLTDQELSNLHWLLSVAKFGSACENYNLNSQFVFLSDGKWTEDLRQKVLGIMNKGVSPLAPYPPWVNASYIPKPDLPVNKFQVLGQRDIRWKSKYLGTSKTTIGDYGCLLTCFAMLAGMLPDEMNTAMVQRGMFTDGNKANTFDISSINSKVKYLGVKGRYTGLVPADVMQDLYNHLKTQPAIIEVDFNKYVQDIQQHFVLATGIENGKIMIHDPWTNDHVPLCPRWGDTEPIAIWRIIKYSVS